MNRTNTLTRSALLIFMLCMSTGCPSQDNDEAPDMARVDMPGGVGDDMPSTSDDAGQDEPDQAVEGDDGVGDLGLDMGEDFGPPRCAGEPPCLQGYAYNETCSECIAPKDRRCEVDEECREGESCEEVPRSSGTRTIQICLLDESTLTVDVCPGGPGCDTVSGAIRAAAVSKIVTPQGFETAKPEGLDGAYMNFSPPISASSPWNDCGYDGLCPGDEGYVAPDEGEGDGELQGMWIAGFNSGRPAQYCPDDLIGCDAPGCCVSQFAHDDLRVQIMVFEQGSVRVAFAVLDAVGYFHTYIERIRRAVEEQADIDLLIMASTHSHESPDTVGQWGPGSPAPASPGRDARHMKRIEQETIAGITEAVAALQPATIEIAVLDTGIEGLAMGDSRPPYIFDDNVPVVRVTSATSGEPIGTMLSVANHAEVLWSGNPYISSDYFHFTREYVADGLRAVAAEDAADGEAKPALEGFGGVTVMFAGAVGGLINPGRSTATDYAGVVYDEHGFDKADAVGQRLAMHVLRAHAGGRFETLDDQAGLSFATKRFLTPITNKLFLLAGFVANLFERDMYNASNTSLISFEPDVPHVMSQVAVVQLGPLTFFTAPGEVFPETLVGGYPDRPSTQTPVLGDVLEERVAATCDMRGLPPMDGDVGVFPCLVKADQENPPEWSLAPQPPYGYDLVPGRYPFFIGLGMDFLGYMVPTYDYEPDNAPGAHYEETNGASGQFIEDWLTNLNASVDALP